MKLKTVGFPSPYSCIQESITIKFETLAKNIEGGEGVTGEKGEGVRFLDPNILLILARISKNSKLIYEIMFSLTSGLLASAFSIQQPQSDRLS